MLLSFTNRPLGVENRPDRRVGHFAWFTEYSGRICTYPLRNGLVMFITSPFYRTGLETFLENFGTDGCKWQEWRSRRHLTTANQTEVNPLSSWRMNIFYSGPRWGEILNEEKKMKRAEWKSRRERKPWMLKWKTQNGGNVAVHWIWGSWCASFLQKILNQFFENLKLFVKFTALKNTNSLGHSRADWPAYFPSNYLCKYTNR